MKMMIIKTDGAIVFSTQIVLIETLNLDIFRPTPSLGPNGLIANGRRERRPKIVPGQDRGHEQCDKIWRNFATLTSY